MADQSWVRIGWIRGGARGMERGRGLLASSAAFGVCVLSAALGACGLSDGRADDAARERELERGAAAQTESVVHSVHPAPAASAGSALPGARSSASMAANAEDRSSQRNRAISSKHLEAELNRLEAELGR